SSQSVPQGAKVFFDRIMVPAVSYQIVKIACMLLAESTALEYYEVLIENLLEQTNRFSKQLQKHGRMLKSGEQLIRFIGMCLDTKQSIISNLYIVDSPDETWDNVELDKLHQELKIMLEIDTRYRALDYKIKIIQEGIEVIVDLSKSRRETLLELVIILLIAFEIFLTLIKWH
ncbi:MAG: RMD1 family protein, partial [Candidatus Poribacteria bacterium]